MYSCKVCLFQSSSAVGYMKHYRVHSNLSSVPCGIGNCNQHFRKLSSFYCHVHRYHGLIRDKNKRNYLQNIGVTAKCMLSDCQKVVELTDLMKHLKAHIAVGVKIQCPVAGCGRFMSYKTTFTAHMSVKHGSLNRSNINTDLLCDFEQSYPVGLDDIQNAIVPEVCDETNDSSDGERTKDALLRNLALFLLNCNVV
jgi:hypothetical protein